MDTHRRYLAILGTAFAFMAVCRAQENPPNLIVNGSFEEVDADGGAVGWGTWLKTLPEPGCISTDETFAHSGERSLRISHAKPTSYSPVQQRVEFEANRHYVVTGWIKGDDIKPGPGSMLARLYIGKEGGGTFKVSRTFSGTFDWTFIEIGPFEVKERTWLTVIPYLHQATGTVWFDDIVFRQVTEADMRRRAQRRARDILLDDLHRIRAVAQDAGAQDVLDDVSALRQQASEATDLPVSLDARSGPPYFPLHAQAYKLMARTNQSLWADLKSVPSVYAHWSEPFDDVAPLHPTPPQTDGVPWLVEMLRDEVEPACIRLTNLSQADQDVALSLTALQSKAGDLLPAEKIAWRRLQYVETRNGRVIGDPLVRLGTGAGPIQVSLPAGMTQDIWVMIDSTGTPAGQFEGAVSVTTPDAAPQKLLLSVIVYDIQMPAQVPIHTFAYAYTTWGLLSGRTEQSRADLVAHRVNTYVIHGGFTPWPTFDDEGAWQGLDWSRMDQQIELHKGAKCLLLWPGLEMGDRMRKLTPEGGPQYPTEEWKPFASRWARELATGMAQRGFGYDQWALYLVDEPSARRAQIARTAGDAVHAGDPNIRVFENPYGAATRADMELMAPAVDIWCPMLNTAKDERLELCRETADEVWTYQVLGKTSHPLKVFRLAFWECFEKDLRGHGFWDYADSGGSVWDAWDSDRHDYAVVYDGDETELTPSKRWEAYREGAEDFALLSMLRASADSDVSALTESLPSRVKDEGTASATRKARQQIIRALVRGTAQ